MEIDKDISLARSVTQDSAALSFPDSGLSGCRQRPVPQPNVQVPTTRAWRRSVSGGIRLGRAGGNCPSGRSPGLAQYALQGCQPSADITAGNEPILRQRRLEGGRRSQHAGGRDGALQADRAALPVYARRSPVAGIGNARLDEVGREREPQQGHIAGGRREAGRSPRSRAHEHRLALTGASAGPSTSPGGFGSSPPRPAPPS